LDRLYTISLSVLEVDARPYKMLFRNLYKWHLSAPFSHNIKSIHSLYAIATKQWNVLWRTEIDCYWLYYCV